MISDHNYLGCYRKLQIPCDGHSYTGSYKQAAGYLSYCVCSSQNKDRKHQLPYQKCLQNKRGVILQNQKNLELNPTCNLFYKKKVVGFSSLLPFLWARKKKKYLIQYRNGRSRQHGCRGCIKFSTIKHGLNSTCLT